jgi:hypothetical protein
MARRIRESILDSRDARAKLKVGGKPYWRSIGSGLHVGYRKGKDARRWVARIYVGSGQLSSRASAMPTTSPMLTE